MVERENCLPASCYRVWLLIAVSLLLTSCSGTPANNVEPNAHVMPTPGFLIPTLPADLPVFFPRQELVDGEWVRMTGEVLGRLVDVDGCLRLDSSDGSTSYLVVWPPHYTAWVENDSIQILDHADHDRVLALVGEEVQMGGGGLSSLDYPSVPKQLAQEIPSDCPGPYWISGGIISR